MVRKLIANENIISLEKLEDIYKKERDYRIRERLQCIIWSIEEKISALKISKRLKKNDMTIRSWIKAFNKNGIEGLKPMFNGGAISKISKIDADYIISLLDENPEDYGFLTNIWDCKLLAAAFGEKNNTVIHKDVVWRMLKKRGYSYKKPEVVNPKADQQLKKNQLNNLKTWKKR